MRLNPKIRKYKEFSGKAINAIPSMLSKGRSPISSAQLMKERIESRNTSDSELYSNWICNYFSTGDGALYLPDGSLVIDYDSQALRKLSSESGLNESGALTLEGLTANDVEGALFTKKELKKMILGKKLTLKEAKDHPIWQALARGDKKLSEAYAETIFSQIKALWDGETYGPLNMGILLDSYSKIPKLKSWEIRGIGDSSYASGTKPLNDEKGSFIGVLDDSKKDVSKSSQ